MSMAAAATACTLGSDVCRGPSARWKAPAPAAQQLQGSIHTQGVTVGCRQRLGPKPRGSRVWTRVSAQASSSRSAAASNGAARQVLLVDPLQAKQLAEEDMGRRIARARAQRFRDIEAVNGAWAVLGLAAALVGEGMTGEGILGQVALYLTKVSSFLEGLEASL